MKKEETKVLEMVAETEILGKSIKFYGTIENPLFLSRDVAKWIEHTNVTMMIKTVESEEKVKVNNVYFENRTGGNGTWFLTEDGLYEVCMQSRKPIAKQMKKEIKAYLKQIRLTGGYIPITEEDNDSLIMAKAIKIADATIKQKDIIIESQKQRIDELIPIEENYKILMDTKGTFSMNEVAHFVGIGEYKLFEFLRSVDILFFNKNKDNVPYENATNKTKFKVVPAISPDGESHSVTRVLPSGIDYICKLIKKYGLVEVA